MPKDPDRDDFVVVYTPYNLSIYADIMSLYRLGSRSV